MLARVSQEIRAAVEVVRSGGIIAYPTEAVFGLGCDPANLSAVQRLLALKQRPAHKGLILIISDLNQITAYLQPLEDALLSRIQPTWPGPVTWLLPVKSSVSPLVRGDHNTLAVRLSAHPVCQRLCEELGHPLISTSANIANEAPAREVATLQKTFGNQLQLIVDLPLGGNANPSEIRDALTGEVQRAG